MTYRTQTTRTPAAQPALGFTFTPSRSNEDYALAAGLVPASETNFVAKPPPPAPPLESPYYAPVGEVARVVTVYQAVTVQDTRRADLHHTIQAALNVLTEVSDLDPEAGKQIAAADAALRALLKRIDAA